MGLRDLILAADDMVTEDVEVPEWNMTITVKALTGTERDRFEASMQKMTRKGPQQDLENVRARLIVLTAIDPNDNNLPIFTDKDVAALGRKSGKALDRLFSAASRLSGLSPEDVERLTETFKPAQSESSTQE